jgi:acetyl-CoA carboxylase biotin carboxyl carrier protein
VSVKGSGPIDPEELGQLLRAIEASKLVEVEIEYGDLHLRVLKEGASPREASTPRALDRVARERSKNEVPLKPAGRTVELKSPMLGVFYRCPEPGAPPFVDVGRVVQPQDAVGLIEVMKLFTQVQAGVNGRIVQILVEDAAMVQQDQPLMIIEAAE